MKIYSWIMTLVYICNIITILYMIFKEKRNSTSVICWTLILSGAPAIGLFAYILVGRKISQSKMYGVSEANAKVYQDFKEKMQEDTARHTNEISKENLDMIQCLENMSYSPYREGNDIKFFDDGKIMFNQLKEDLRKAKKYINFQFYILKLDGIGKELLDIMTEKLKEGVEVRILYDALGGRTIKRHDFDEFKKLGGKVGEFFPTKILPINININHRNHRKIVVIDGNLGYVGGFNVGDEYLGLDKKFGYWRDTHIRIEGNAVKDLNLRFKSDWEYATKEGKFIHEPFTRLLSEATEKNCGNTGVQIMSSGPNERNLFEIKMGYLKMIQRAKDYIYIQSPYLILDYSILDAIKLAALSGVDVRIMIPGKGDHPFVYWANLAYAGEIVRYGVKIYHYDANAFIHSKTVVIDDKICAIGTANMDTRSFELNFEVCAFMYGEEIAKTQREAFERDMKKSTEMSQQEYDNRSQMVKIKEGFSRLFSLVL